MTKLRFYLNVTHRHEKNKIQFDVLEHLRSIEKNDNPFRMFCLSSVYSTFVVRSIFAAYQRNLFKNNQFLDDHYDGRDKLDYGRFADDLFDCNCAGIDSALAFFGRVLQIKESYTRHFNNIVNNTNVKWYIPFFLSVVQNLNALWMRTYLESDRELEELFNLDSSISFNKQTNNFLTVKINKTNCFHFFFH